MDKPSVNIKTHQSVTTGGSVFSRYCNVVLGSNSISDLIRYELGSLCTPFRGALGFFLRSVFYPKMFGGCGKGTLFGANMTLMQPKRVFLGREVVIGDNCILDARSPQLETVLSLADSVILSHGVLLSAIGGEIKIGERTGLGAYTVVRSSKNNPVTIGNDVAVGHQCCIVGGGDYNTDRLDIPICQQGLKETGGSTIGDGVWLGAQVTVLGGVKIGEHCIIGAGSVVTKSIPPYSIAVGVPAKVAKQRTS